MRYDPATTDWLKHECHLDIPHRNCLSAAYIGNRKPGRYLCDGRRINPSAPAYIEIAEVTRQLWATNENCL